MEGVKNYVIKKPPIYRGLGESGKNFIEYSL